MSRALTIDIAWPTDLPLPFVDYAAANRNATISSTTELGPIERRSRFDKFYIPVSCSWRLTQAQSTAFRTFFETTLGNGSAAFSLELRYPKNTGLTTWLVRFIGGFAAEWLDGIWAVTARIDLIDSALLEDAVETVVGYVPFMVIDEDESDGYVPFYTSEGFEFRVRE